MYMSEMADFALKMRTILSGNAETDSIIPSTGNDPSTTVPSSNPDRGMV